MGKIFYGWIIALTSLISLMIVFGARLSFQVFFVALIEDFGWSRASTAGAFSLSMLVFAVTSPLFGWLFDRFGPRWMFSVGATFFASGLWISSQITSQSQLYFWYGIVASIGITILGLTNYATLIAHWFQRQRGTAMGVAFAGTGLGSLLIVPLTEYWIGLWGWREALMGQSLLLVSLVFPLSILLLRLHPSQMGLFPDGDIQRTPLQKSSSNTVASPPTINWTVGAALQTPTFWLLIIAAFGGLFSLRMLTVHQVAAAVDVGFDRFFVATIMGFSGGVTVVAFIVWGIVADRIGRRFTFVISSVTMGGAIICILVLQDSSQAWLLYLYAILFGLGEGSRSSLLAAIISDTFPGDNVGRINGFVGMAFGSGAATGPWLAGYLFDLTGSYATALWVSLGVTGVSVLGVVLARWFEKQHYI